MPKTKPITKKGLEALLRKADKKIAALINFKEGAEAALSSNPPTDPPKFPR